MQSTVVYPSMMRMHVQMMQLQPSTAIPPKHNTLRPMPVRQPLQPSHELAAIARAQAYAHARQLTNRQQQQQQQPSHASPVTAAVVAAAMRSRNRGSRQNSPQTTTYRTSKSQHASPMKSTAPVDKAPQAPQTVEWRVAIDPKSKRPYYYHPITRETTWKKPQELIEKEKREKAQFFSAMENNIRTKLRAGHWLRDDQTASGSSNNSTAGSETDEVPDLTTLDDIAKKRGPFVHQSKSVPTTPERATKAFNHYDHSNNNDDEDIPAAATKPPLLFRTLSSYETPVVSMKKNGRIMSPIQERVRLASMSPEADNNNAKTLMEPQAESKPEQPEQPEKESDELLQKAAALRPPARRRSNSTSTIFVRMGTMNAPDQDCTIQCVATVLRAHMMEASEHPLQRMDPTYNVFINRRDHNMASNTIPSLHDIGAFMKHVFSRAQMESECIIMSLVYVERLLKATAGSLQLTPSNWRSILFCSMVMASKVWDDLSMCNADFSKIWPELTLKEINELELAYLSAVEYNVRVSAVSYAKYYFHLRSMCASMGILVAKFDESAPLNLDGARKMQVLSEEYQERSKLMPTPLRRRSVTITSASTKEPTTASKARPAASLEQLVQMQVRGAGGMALGGMHRLSSKA